MGTDDAFDAAWVDVQNFLIQEQDRGEGLVLGAGRHFPFHRQVREEGVDFWRTHFKWVTFVVEKDEAFAPIVVGVLGANGVMANAAGVAEAVEEFGWLSGHADIGTQAVERVKEKIKPTDFCPWA